MHGLIAWAYQAINSSLANGLWILQRRASIVSLFDVQLLGRSFEVVMLIAQVLIILLSWAIE